MTRPIYEPTDTREAARSRWDIDQLYRRPAENTIGVAIDSEVVWNAAVEETSIIYRNVGDDNAYWDSATCVKVVYTWRPSAFLTAEINGVAIGVDPDTAEQTIFLASGSGSTTSPDVPSPIANLWQVQTPMAYFHSLPEASSALTSVWAEADLQAIDGTANSFLRSQSDQIFEPHLSSEGQTQLALGFVADMLSANPTIAGTDPAAPLRLIYSITVRWFYSTPFADWPPGDEDDIATANLPTDTRFYVNLLAQVTP